jgi:hypothetical protein
VHGQEELPHDEHPGGVGHQRQDHARVGIEQVQFLEHQERRDQQHHAGHRHHRDDRGEQPAPAAEPQPGQGVPGHRVEQHPAEGHEHRHHHRVGQPAQEILLLELAERGQHPVLRERVERVPGGIGLGLERGADVEQERVDVQHREERQRQVEQYPADQSALSDTRPPHDARSARRSEMIIRCTIVSTTMIANKMNAIAAP